jgi:hypothetical protein
MSLLERKDITLGWLMNLRKWIWKADLSFESLAAPERAEKAVRNWINKIIPGSWVIVGYERQERGAVHAHLIVDMVVPWGSGTKLWEKQGGFCRIGRIKNKDAAIRYAVKHAVKFGDFDIYGPGTPGKLYSTLGLVDSKYIGMYY